MRVFLKWGITIALLFVVFRYVDWGGFAAALKSADIRLYLMSTVAFLGSFLILAARLKALLDPTELNGLRWSELLKLHLSSVLYGFFLPSEVGSAAIRWYQVTRNEKGRGVFVLVTVIERLLTIATTLILAVIPLILSDAIPAEVIRPRLLPVLLVLAVLALSALLVCFLPTAFNLAAVLVRAAERLFTAGVFRKALGIFWQIELYLDNPRAVWKALGFHIAFQCLLLVRFVILFLCLRIQVPLMDAVWISMVVAFLTLIPISVAGLGVREGGFVLLLSLFGVEPAQAVLLGVLAFAQVVLVLLWGGLAVVSIRRKASNPNTG